MRISDWSSDVCSSDLLIGDEMLADDGQRRAWLAAAAARIAYQMEDEPKGQKLQTTAFSVNNNHSPPRKRPLYVARPAPGKQSTARSEERRGGKEGVSTCRSRRSASS